MSEELSSLSSSLSISDESLTFFLPNEYGLVDRIKNGEFTNIIICTGAGISTSAGIPDYRSSSGLFSTFTSKYPYYEPSEIFTLAFRENHPEFISDPDYLAFLEKINSAVPTPAHELCIWLNNKGWIKRVYTQNVDRLHLKAISLDKKLPKEKLVEYHGYLDFKEKQEEKEQKEKNILEKVKKNNR